MFSRASCYFFVRPQRNFLEAVLFLGRTLRAAQVRRTQPASRTKVAHILHIRHRDEVEAPITDWLQEAYEFSGMAGVTTKRAKPKGKRAKPKAKRTGPVRGKER
jgi:hypothetical protein